MKSTQPTIRINLVSILLLLTAISVSSLTMADNFSQRRVPAEWEPQEAIWLQWPGAYEKTFEVAFAKMASVIVQYQKLHLLCDTERIKNEARAAIEEVGLDPDHPNITWHILPNDNAWMRDNGPVYVMVGNEMRIQNWEFDAWGGAFGSYVPYAKDNRVPDKVAEFLDMPIEQVDIVHERGNLEFNGVDTLILNWSALGDPDRNSGYTKDQATSDLKRWFGVSKVIFIEGIPETDLTKGHVDGIARFIDANTVVVPECTHASRCKPGDGRDDAVYNNAAKTIADAGFRVIRDPMEATVEYNGKTFDTNYANWTVGNGFVLLVGFNNPETDLAAKARVESYFPGRDVHVVEMLSSWASGGGAHCHTNDQPALKTPSFQ